MDLIEIGSILREGRERLGLSVETVEERTKIAPNVILALEEGNRDRFPHPVYARGFVRSYALLLGLDAVELCAHFSREYPVPIEADHPDLHAPQISVKTHDMDRHDLLYKVGAAIGIVALGVTGWYLFDVYRNRQHPVPVPVVAPAPTVEKPQAPAAQVAKDQPAPLTQMQEVASLPEAVNQTGSQNATVVDKVASGAPAAPNNSTVIPAALPGGRTMRIIAHATSWLQVRADDKVDDYLLRKGESTSIGFAKSLSIKFGNAGGVKLELDGKPYPFDAGTGEVKTLVVK